MDVEEFVAKYRDQVAGILLDTMRAKRDGVSQQEALDEAQRRWDEVLQEMFADVRGDDET